MKQKHIIELTGQSKNTLNNWVKNKPNLHEIIVKGCQRLLDNYITSDDFLIMGDSLSKTTKLVDIKVVDIIKLTGQSRQTLSNWLVNKPFLLLVIMVGIKKQFNINEFDKFITVNEVDPIMLIGESKSNLKDLQISKPKLYKRLVAGSKLLDKYSFDFNQNFQLNTPSYVLKIAGVDYSKIIFETDETRSNLNYWCKSKPLFFLSILVSFLPEKKFFDSSEFGLFFSKLKL